MTVACFGCGAPYTEGPSTLPTHCAGCAAMMRARWVDVPEKGPIRIRFESWSNPLAGNEKTLISSADRLPLNRTPEHIATADEATP